MPIEPLPIETLRWSGNALELIDQRLLPARLIYATCNTADEVASAIKNMTVRGAPAIGCAAAFGVALAGIQWATSPRADFFPAVQGAIDRLAESRPTAVNLFWALDRMRNVLAEHARMPVEAIARTLLLEAQNILAEDIATNQILGQVGQALVPEAARIMTHCNAGALATAGYGTALGVVRAARDAGKSVAVIANETRPMLQGARLTAWEMTRENIPVTLITDNMAATLMREGVVDLVIVGADRIAANGDTANKVGTYALAILARHHQVPFYVAAPTSTIDLSTADGRRIPIEERAGDEVRGFGSRFWAPEDVPVRNPSFDVTPAGLISALITEKGVVQSLDAGSIEAMMAR